MLAAEDDPEGEQHGVEDALPDVSKKQHPGPVEADGEPLHGDVDERHGDTESEDYPAGAETPRCYAILLSINKTSARITEEHLDERRRIRRTRGTFLHSSKCVVGRCWQIKFRVGSWQVLHLNTSGRSGDVSKRQPGQANSAAASYFLRVAGGQPSSFNPLETKVEKLGRGLPEHQPAAGLCTPPVTEYKQRINRAK